VGINYYESLFIGVFSAVYGQRLVMTTWSSPSLLRIFIGNVQNLKILCKKKRPQG